MGVYQALEKMQRIFQDMPEVEGFLDGIAIFANCYVSHMLIIKEVF